MGLIKGTVKLESDYKKFINEYKLEKENLQKILNDEIIVIEHIGSTSVEGLKAKPIIDIAVGVVKFKNFEYYVNLFNFSTEYEIRNNLDIGEILIVKGNKEYTSILIHLMELNSVRYNETILFRDYLRNNKNVLLKYQKLKEELALKYSSDRVMYTKSKNDFIKEIIEKANKQKMLPVTFFNLTHVFNSELTRVILVCRYKYKWLLCKHKEKGTWEVPGGHIEAGEDWLTAAKRELLEETGITKANIERICFYKISTYGLVCYADVIELGSNDLVHEMEEVALFDELPLNMTYYDTHKKFIDKVSEVKNDELRMNKKDLLKLINDLKLDKDKFWVISSGALVLRDLLHSAGDLDLAVTEKGFEKLKKNYDLNKTEKGTYQITKNIECLVDTKDDWKYENVDGINIERLEKYFEYLKTSTREKDKSKYEIIKEKLNI